MSKFLSERYAAISPYTPGEQLNDRKYIKLNTNESPYSPSPKVLEAIGDSTLMQLNLYPDPELKQFTAALSYHFGVDEEQIIITNGSDEALFFAFQAFCDSHTPPCFPDITYGFYKVFAQILSLQPKIIPLDGDYRININDYKGLGGTIFIANPNAPTGILLPLDAIKQVLADNPDNLVVVDEAYIDFGGESAIDLLPHYDNLMVIQTFSKSRSLAGGRIGFAVASKEIIADMKKMKFSFNPYSVNRLSALAGTASIKDNAYFIRCARKIIKTREYVQDALTARGFRLLPSQANFIFAAHPTLSGADFYQKLRDNGVLVRYFDAPRTKDFVRITIGSNWQMKKFIKITDKIGGLK